MFVSPSEVYFGFKSVNKCLFKWFCDLGASREDITLNQLYEDILCLFFNIVKQVSFFSCLEECCSEDPEISCGLTNFTCLSINMGVSRQWPNIHFWLNFLFSERVPGYDHIWTSFPSGCYVLMLVVRIFSSPHNKHWYPSTLTHTPRLSTKLSYHPKPSTEHNSSLFHLTTARCGRRCRHPK